MKNIFRFGGKKLGVWLAIAGLWLGCGRAVAQLPQAVSVSVVTDTNSILQGLTNLFATNVVLISNAIAPFFPTFVNFTNSFAPVATPTANLPQGNYYTNLTVTLSDSMSIASIYYTIDGTSPLTNGILYTNAITLTSSKSLQAVATAPYRAPSTIITNGYQILQGNYIYWGLNTNTTITGAQMAALGNSIYQGAISGTYTFGSTGGYYYFGFPLSMISNAPPVLINGWNISDSTGAALLNMASGTYGTATDGAGGSYITVTNASIPYGVYRSQYPINGAGTVTVTGAALQ